MRRIIYDTLKEDGKWSKSALMIFFTFWSNLLFAGWCVYKTTVFVDLPVNWLALILALYGMNKTAATIATVKAVPGTTTTTSSTETKVEP